MTFEIIGEASAVAAEGVTIIGKYAVSINPYALASLAIYEAAELKKLISSEVAPLTHHLIWLSCFLRAIGDEK